MIKVTLDYDEISGNLYDNNSNLIISWPGLMNSKDDDAKNSIVNDMKELKAAGFTAEEIMQMKREGAI